jgi:GT2 family glycosyltransferase
MTVPAVDAVLAAAAQHDDDVEVVVVDNGSARVVWATLLACFGSEARVRLRRNVRNLNFALGSNTGVAEASGDTIVFLNNDTEVKHGWLAPLLAALADADVLAAQPLLVYPDRTVQCAGVVFPGLDGLPVHFLAHHPQEDAYALEVLAPSALTGAALALRTSDVLELQGFDPLFTNGWEDIDLCLRLAQIRPGRFAVPTSSVVEHHESKTPGRGRNTALNRQTFMDRWRGRLPREDRAAWASVGFEVTHYVPDPLVEPAPDADPAAAAALAVPRVARPVVRRVPPAEASDPPRLRWALKTEGTVPREHKGIVRLLGALTALGQEPVVDWPGAYERATCYLDDVVVDLSGGAGFAVQPGRVNLLGVGGPVDTAGPQAERYHGVVSTVGDPDDVARTMLDLALKLRADR